MITGHVTLSADVPSRQEPDPMPRNYPVVTLTAFVVLTAMALLMVMTGASDGDAGSRLTNSILAALPVLLVAGGYAERNNRDMRNGVLPEQVRKGTHKALDEKQVVTRDGPVAHAIDTHTRALIDVLEDRGKPREAAALRAQLEEDASHDGQETT